MTDRHILFSAPMVRALLAGEKTQTRRVLKPQPLPGWEFQGFNVNGQALYYPPDSLGMGTAMERAYEEWDGLLNIRYATGDRLWVRETWGAEACYDEEPPRDIHPEANVLFLADNVVTDTDPMIHFGKTRPAIFMPRWASRLTLIVTEVRIERLQETSHDDTVAEGVGIFPHSMSAQKRFRELWNSIHGAGAWDENPEVVALTFTAHKSNIDRIGEAA